MKQLSGAMFVPSHHPQTLDSPGNDKRRKWKKKVLYDWFREVVMIADVSDVFMFLMQTPFSASKMVPRQSDKCQLSE